MMSRSLRGVVVGVVVACLAIGGALAANVALLGLADRPHDRVGRLQLRLDKPTSPQASTSATTTQPGLVETASQQPQVDDERGADD